MSDCPERFSALRIHAGENKQTLAKLEEIGLDDLSDGDVVIRTAWSGINYKDALAVTGSSRIMKNLPCVAGIDVAGTVVSSEDANFKVGDAVIACGAGLGEDFDGGFAEYARLRSGSTVPLPTGLSLREAMGIGTAGFTAALAIHQLEHNGTRPDSGPIAVTGPTGGVGGIAIDLLKQRGYQVTAVTHRSGQEDYLRSLGADEILITSDMEFGPRPLEQALWAGAIDNVGGDVLSWLCRTTQQWGNVASIGLAASHKLSCSVMPFILRGVNLLGINSVYPPQEKRLATWARLASDLRPSQLANIVQREVELKQLPEVCTEYMENRNQGRTLVNISGDE